MKLLFLVLIAFSFFISGCETKYETATKYWWKHGEGSSIGDVIILQGDYYSLDKEMNIYNNGKKVAEIISVSNHKLTIKTLDQKTGIYFNKGAAEEMPSE
ncbi:MAG: hypothetical protein K8F30_07365 [Taibaiella sp.]|nr:hypothetical protein [Taibaiella sp.]